MARLRFLQIAAFIFPSFPLSSNNTLLPFLIFIITLLGIKNTTTSERDIYLLRLTRRALCRERASHLLTLQTPQHFKEPSLNHQTIRLYHHRSLALVSTLSTATLQITTFDLPIKTRLSLQTAFFTQETSHPNYYSPSAKANPSITPITPGIASSSLQYVRKARSES